MTRLPRIAWCTVAAGVSVVLMGAGCGTGRVSPSPQSTASAVPSATTSAAPVAAAGFPGDQDGAVLAAARTFVTTVTTYDHTKLGDQRNALLPLTGEPLKSQLSATLADGGDFAKAATASSRDAKGTVLDLGLVRREGDRAVVVVFVDQQVTQPSGSTTQRLRERVTLDRSPTNTWLATKLETV